MSTNKIKRGYLQTPDVFFVTKRIQPKHRHGFGILGDMTELMDWPGSTKKTMKFWNNVSSAYKIHRWNRPKKLLHYQGFGGDYPPRAVYLDIKREFYGLQELSGKFANCSEIYDKGMLKLNFQITRNLNNLLSLNLAFYRGTLFSVSNIKRLARDIGLHLIHLQKLDLTFGMFKINDQDLKSLGLKLFRHLTKLKHFGLGLYSCDSITDTGVNTLISQVNYFLRELHSFGLTIFDCQNITAKSSEILRSGVGVYPEKLKSLRLEYSENNVIDNEVFENLAALMTHLPNLINLELFIRKCSRITSEGLQVLIEVIASSTPKLTKFTFNPAMNNISPETIDQLCRKLPVIPKIRLDRPLNPNAFHFVDVDFMYYDSDDYDQDQHQAQNEDDLGFGL